MSIELSWSAEEMRDMTNQGRLAQEALKALMDAVISGAKLGSGTGDNNHYWAEVLREIGTRAVNTGGLDPAPVIPQPTRDLILSLCSAVVRSEDDDCSASESLEKLQKRVLMACARFEAATVIV